MSIFCSACGAQANDGQRFCMKCGTPLVTTGTQQQTNTQQGSYAPHGTYNAAGRYNTPGSNYNPYGHTIALDDDLNAFVQTNQVYYFNQFKKLNNQYSKISWNWCSFMFSNLWFIYRKMYGIGVLLWIISFVLSMIPIIGTALSWGVAIVSGMFGNYLYKEHAYTKISEAKNMDHMTKKAYIADKGGTSAGAVWAAIGISFILVIIITILLIPSMIPLYLYY